MRALAGLAAAGTIALLAGCGTTAAPASGGTAAAPSATGAAAATSSAPSCHELYKAWQDSPAKPLGKKIVPALNKVQAAGSSEDIPELNAALTSAGKIARQLTAYPMPACADPRGYWTQMLGYLRAAGDNAGTSNGLAGLMTAMAPLEKVPAVEKKLETEIKKNAGVS